MKERFEIAAGLRRIARLLGIKGENPYKMQAYERGARALESFAGDFEGFVKQRRLREVPGIGAGLAAAIEEMYTTGECWLLEELHRNLPPGAIELSEIPGLNLKKITALHDALSIESVAELKSACEEGRVRGVKGFGVKSEAKLLAEIRKLESPQDGALPLPAALERAENILRHLRACPDLIQAEAAGGLRRWAETVAKIRIIAAGERPQAVLDQFLRFPGIIRTDELDEGRCAARLTGGAQAELEVVRPDEYVSALHDATGSRGHVAKLRTLARARRLGWEIGVKSEEEIYRRLGMPDIPPELREDEGEIEAAAARRLPRLIAPEDIRGMTHCHTVYSDGNGSIEEMARAAEAMGMTFLTITDHSPSAHYARGLSLDRLRAQWDEIDRVQERVKIKLLKGTESDILENGLLDYPDHVLERLDIIIASIHARHKMDESQMTERLLRAIRLPFFKVWGHPLGRLIPSRPPFACRMEEVLDAVAEAKCAIEVNGDPKRLDLEPRWIRAAQTRGVKFVISTDAHSTGGLRHSRYGVAMARRGWLTRGEVLNALDAEEFAKAVRP